MRHFARLVVAAVLLLALLPLTAFAAESTEYPTTALPPDQALLVRDMQAINAASTPADVANVTAQYYDDMGGVIKEAENDMFTAQAIVTEHPNDVAAAAQLASAQANYQQLMKLCGLELPTLTFTTPVVEMTAPTDMAPADRESWPSAP